MKIRSSKFRYITALLIDDNFLDNFINQKMLESNNFSENIIVSPSGTDALDVINGLIASNEALKLLPEVMFVDLNMPAMSGFKFIENFRKINNEQLNNCRIVVLTSSISNEDKVYTENLDPAIVFINKPLTNEFLNNF